MREREDVIYYAKESDDFIIGGISNNLPEWVWKKQTIWYIFK